MDKLIPFNLEQAKAGKSIQCRNGTPAKFIAHVPDAEHDCVIILVNKVIHVIHSNGYYFKHTNSQSIVDLFMVPEKKTAWLNCHPDMYFSHSSRAEADKRASPLREACIEVVYTVGQGL